MSHSEKKYQVDSFDQIMLLLQKKGTAIGNEIISTHYYAIQDNNDVVKLVVYSDKSEIHIWKEQNGTFAMVENISVQSIDAGFLWLKNNGHHQVHVVNLRYTNFSYKKGIVGLYVVDDFLYSVILDYPSGMHAQMEKELGLDSNRVISVAYNIYLAQIGKLVTREL